jgi:hypothetical protein
MLFLSFRDGQYIECKVLNSPIRSLSRKTARFHREKLKVTPQGALGTLISGGTVGLPSKIPNLGHPSQERPWPYRFQRKCGSPSRFELRGSEMVVPTKRKIDGSLGGVSLRPSFLTIVGPFFYPGFAVCPPVARTTQTMGSTRSSLTRVVKTSCAAMTSAMGGLSW